VILSPSADPVSGATAALHALSSPELGLQYAALEGSIPSPEAALVERLQRGEPAAVGEVYDEHHAAVRAFARRLVGEREAAEDLVHDVFVALPRAISRYRGDAALRTFLISIAVNHARHFVRAASRRRAALERLGTVPAGASGDPEQNARRQELARAITRALDGLPIDQRVAFVLCEVEERTSQEVAKITGVPEGTVRTRLHHARKKLATRLEQEGYR
jgi:RNA polymerase sigma-70 factor, ECF subfamily